MLFVKVMQLWFMMLWLKLWFCSFRILVRKIFCYPHSTINNSANKQYFWTKFSDRFSNLLGIKYTQFYSDLFRSDSVSQSTSIAVFNRRIEILDTVPLYASLVVYLRFADNGMLVVEMDLKAYNSHRHRLYEITTGGDLPLSPAFSLFIPLSRIASSVTSVFFLSISSVLYLYRSPRCKYWFTSLFQESSGIERAWGEAPTSFLAVGWGSLPHRWLMSGQWPLWRHDRRRVIDVRLTNAFTSGDKTSLTRRR